MKTTQFARFLAIIALALVFANCTGSNEPFFHYNSPFGDKNKPAAFNGFGNQPAPDDGVRDIGDPRASNLPANAGQMEDGRGQVKSAGATPAADTPPAPEIHIHKRGPAGSVCYTCRGKGYVLQPLTTSTGDIYKCPACGGDGRY